MPIELTPNEKEAVNRAESTALLIRAGFRVYRPEADCHGEDLILRKPNGELLAVQLKGRATVDWNRYGNRSLWMLFPDQPFDALEREWFLVPHDPLYEWVKNRHGHTAGWNGVWSYPEVSEVLRPFLHTITVIRD